MAKVNYEDMIDDSEDFDDEEEEEREQEEAPLKIKKPLIQKEKVVKKRGYEVFVAPERVGVRDSETHEIIAEGQYGIYQTLATILTKLEQIQDTLGSMVES